MSFARRRVFCVCALTISHSCPADNPGWRRSLPAGRRHKSHARCRAVRGALHDRSCPVHALKRRGDDGIGIAMKDQYILCIIADVLVHIIAVGVDDGRQRSLYILWKIQDPIDLVFAPFDEEFFLRIGIVSIQIRCGGRRCIGYVFFVWRVDAAAEDHPQRQHGEQRTFHPHVRNDACWSTAGWLP